MYARRAPRVGGRKLDSVHGVQLAEDFVVIICHHGIHEDGVDERHTDDSTDQEQEAEIEAHTFSSQRGRAIVGSQGVGYLVPTLDGTDLEDSIDRAQRRLEMLGIGFAEETAVDQSEDDNDHQEAKQDSIRLAHGVLEALNDLAEIGED